MILNEFVLGGGVVLYMHFEFILIYIMLELAFLVPETFQNWFKLKFKYGNVLSCPNISAKYGRYLI